MKITKKGRETIFVFKCGVCGCEFEEWIEMCRTDCEKTSLGGGYQLISAECDCPNCRCAVDGYWKNEVLE